MLFLLVHQKYVIFQSANTSAYKNPLQGSWMTHVHNIKHRYCSTEVLFVEFRLRGLSVTSVHRYGQTPHRCNPITAQPEAALTPMR